jgi:hypothetical protein
LQYHVAKKCHDGFSPCCIAMRLTQTTRKQTDPDLGSDALTRRYLWRQGHSKIPSGLCVALECRESSKYDAFRAAPLQSRGKSRRDAFQLRKNAMWRARPKRNAFQPV